MPELDRVVAGMTCRVVLESLSEYLDGELDTAVARRLEAHVAECDNCERFGGRFGALVAGIKEGLSLTVPSDTARLDRVRREISRRLRA